MNAVLGFRGLVLGHGAGPGTAPRPGARTHILRGAVTILNDILDYSKIEAEHLELESIPFDLPSGHATATLLAVERARNTWS